MKKFDYNVITIGAGAAGLVTSYIVAAAKGKVALFEKHKMGGDCLNTGCVPSKALIRSAKFLHEARNSQKLGIEKVDVEFKFSQVMERVQRIVKAIEPHDSIERYTKLGVECFQEKAQVLSPHEVCSSQGQKMTARSLVIATGGRPALPPLPGLSETDFLTSDTVWNLRERPQRLLVLGGGPIGCELAQAFSRLGSKVTQVQKGPDLLNREDQEVSEHVLKKFKEEGISVLTNHQVKSFQSQKAICEYEGKDIEIEFDKVLVCLGRKASVSGFGLEELGVKLTAEKRIAVDSYLRTSLPSLFACGDVSSPYQFTHTAGHQAWYVAMNALFTPFYKFKWDKSVIPWCTYTDPEVARVGLNEKEAKLQNISYDVSTYYLSELDRALTDEAGEGFVKVLTRKNKDKILGVTIVGSHAGDIISEFVFAMKQGLGLNSILSTIHIYPTWAEANKAVAGEWKRKTLSPALLKVSKSFLNWRRSFL